MSKLIINEHPLLVLPNLATAIGLNEAIILQQVHYWIDPRINKNYIDGLYWVYNTYSQWAKQFPFWSEVTIRRTIKNLEKTKLLISADLNKNQFSRQKWYTINYKELAKVEELITNINKNNTPDQFDHLDDYIDPISRSNRSAQPIKLISSYKETKITTKNSLSLKAKNISNQTKESALVKLVEKDRENEMLKIWNKLVEEKNDAIIKLTPKRKKLLNLRLKEVFNNDISLWKDLCKKISSSKFLMGEVTNFKAQLDWTLKEENLLKIMENSYSMGDRLVIESKESIEFIDEVINDPIWKKIREELKKQLGEEVFKSWISKLSFQAISENIAHFTAPTKFIKEWIMNNYSEDIKRNFNAIGTGVQYINIENA